MCTALTLNVASNAYFGRNLDLNCGFGEQVVVTGRNFPFKFTDGSSNESHHAMIGMGTVIQGYPLYAEATNEAGLSIAGLNFPGNAHYFDPVEGKENISPFEFIPWLLANYTSLEEVRPVLKNLNLTNIPFAPQIPLAPLHWIVSDSTGSMVIESQKDGLHLYDNPLGVLTNNPPFSYHLENIKNYMNVTPQWPDNNYAPEIPLTPVGVGFGSFGLPGDTTPASRLVKAVFLRSVTQNQSENVWGKNIVEEEAVGQFFHILDNVGMVKGSTLNQENGPEYTVYSCCCNTTTGVYYYKTYSNSRITAIDMHKTDLDSSELTCFALKREQSIQYEN
ncbi:choloylglycine hydrolase [Actinomycetaceae bacterium TAE3-ERU4]|nr:choloylglycine hydrolase [Actinomycetaceae bacterium TAE3-ERU4]